MEIVYHGHATVQIKTKDHSVIIDPFLSNNPLAKTSPEEIEADYVLLTHGHSDHIEDAERIAKKNGATIVAIVELANYFAWKDCDVVGMNIGGSKTFPFGRVKLTQAFHSSGLVLNDRQEIVYLGMPTGFLLTIEDKTLYHAGDTSLFGDMKTIGELHSIDVAFLPIGDHYTMGPDDALIAARWLRAKKAIPIHYNTFEAIRQDGDAFAARLKEYEIDGVAMKPGERLTLE